MRLQLTVVVLALCAACDDTPSSASSTVGPEGGTLSLGDTTLTIPARALLETTELTVTRAGDAPATFEPRSPLWSFTPSGLTFLEPATVTMAFEGNSSDVVVLWSGSNGALEAVRTEVMDGRASAEITHFSDGVVVQNQHQPQYFWDPSEPEAGPNLPLQALDVTFIPGLLLPTLAIAGEPADAAEETVVLVPVQMDGSLGSPTSLTPLVGTSATAIAAGDLNGDGNADLVVAGNTPNELLSGAIAVMLGDGSGDYGLAQIIEEGLDVVVGVRIADTNRDGSNDMIIALQDAIRILENRDGLDFEMEVLLESPGLSVVEVIDVDGRGGPDLVAGSASGTTVTVLLNEQGEFPNPQAIDVGGAPMAVAPGDPNTDGRVDIGVTTDAGIVVLNNMGDGALVAEPIPNTEGAKLSIWQDLDQDGNPDWFYQHDGDMFTWLFDCPDEPPPSVMFEMDGEPRARTIAPAPYGTITTSGDHGTGTAQLLAWIWDSLPTDPARSSVSIVLVEATREPQGLWWEVFQRSSIELACPPPTDADAGVSDAGASDGGTTPTACDGVSLTDPAGDVTCSFGPCDESLSPSVDVVSSEVRRTANGWEIDLVVAGEILTELPASATELTYGGFFTVAGGHDSGLDVELRYQILPGQAPTAKIFYWEPSSMTFPHVLIAENVSPMSPDRLTFSFSYFDFPLSDHSLLSWHPGAALGFEATFLSDGAMLTCGAE